jgi:hypothetical protein
MLKKVPIVKSLLSYSKINNNVAMQRSAEIAKLLRNIRKDVNFYV